MLSRFLVPVLVSVLALMGCIPESRTQAHANCRLAANDRYPGVYKKLSVEERDARETHVGTCMEAAGYVWDFSDPVCHRGISWVICFKAKSFTARLGRLLN